MEYYLTVSGQPARRTESGVLEYMSDGEISSLPVGGDITLGECISKDSVQVNSEITLRDYDVLRYSGFRDSTVFTSKVYNSQVLGSTVWVSTLWDSQVKQSDVSYSQITDCIIHDSVIGGVSLHNVTLRGADITDTTHFYMGSNFGWEGVDVLFYRLKDGTDYLQVGCWEGTLDTLMSEVYRRSRGQEWREEFVPQYEALHTLLTFQRDQW